MGGPGWSKLRGFQLIQPEQLSELTAGVLSPGGANAPDTAAAEPPWPGTGSAVVTSGTERVNSDTGTLLYGKNHLWELFLDYCHLPWSNFIFISQYFSFFKMR